MTNLTDEQREGYVRCQGCGDILPAGYPSSLCPGCEQQVADYEKEAYGEYERKEEYKRWIEENGEDGHG